jgi:hypothetical protein
LNSRVSQCLSPLILTKVLISGMFSRRICSDDSQIMLRLMSLLLSHHILQRVSHTTCCRSSDIFCHRLLQERQERVYPKFLLISLSLSIFFASQSESVSNKPFSLHGKQEKRKRMCFTS